LDCPRDSGPIARHDLLKGDDNMPIPRNAKRDIAALDKSGDEGEASTLLPMLVGGLILIVVGLIVVMTFV
jgi:hypothetical protein